MCKNKNVFVSKTYAFIVILVVAANIYVQYSHRLSGGEDGVRWCQMLCLSDACSVVSDGVRCFSWTAGEDGVCWSRWFNGGLLIFKLTYNCAHIFLLCSFKTTHISIKPTRPTTKALWVIVHISVASFFQKHASYILNCSNKRVDASRGPWRHYFRILDNVKNCAFTSHIYMYTCLYHRYLIYIR